MTLLYCVAFTYLQMDIAFINLGAKEMLISCLLFLVVLVYAIRVLVSSKRKD